MRSTRYALILFGAGALLGLLLVSANLSGLGIVASALMAAALLFLPFALVADWWGLRPWHKLGTQSKRSRPRRRTKQPAVRQSKKRPK
jgi:hypothetical protein